MTAADAGSKEWPSRQQKPHMQKHGSMRNHGVCEELHMIAYDLRMVTKMGTGGTGKVGANLEGLYIYLSL